MLPEAECRSHCKLLMLKSSFDCKYPERKNRFREWRRVTLDKASKHPGVAMIELKEHVQQHTQWRTQNSLLENDDIGFHCSMTIEQLLRWKYKIRIQIQKPPPYLFNGSYSENHPSNPPHSTLQKNENAKRRYSVWCREWPRN